MSDLNIRLLLHNLWRTWRTSGYERDTPKSYVFMAQEEPIQKAILDQWGITVLEGEGANPQEALSSFLTRLYERVNELRKEPSSGLGALVTVRGSEQ
jgi:hypothetical protein